MRRSANLKGGKVIPSPVRGNQETAAKIRGALFHRTLRLEYCDTNGSWVRHADDVDGILILLLTFLPLFDVFATTFESEKDIGRKVILCAQCFGSGSLTLLTRLSHASGNLGVTSALGSRLRGSDDRAPWSGLQKCKAIRFWP